MQSSTKALTAAAPSILALNRTGSPVEGGMMILIVGANLDPQASVTFGGVPAASTTVDPQSGGLVVITPAHPDGFVDVVVTNPDGQSATSPRFHFGAPPKISAVSPGAAIRKGDVLTITGTGFADVFGVQVLIGSRIAQLTSKSATQLVVLAPKLNAGSYQVVVSNFDSQYDVSAPITFR